MRMVPNPHCTPRATLHPTGNLAATRSAKKLTIIPAVMASWLRETRRPRRVLGASSALYNGTTILRTLKCVCVCVCKDNCVNFTHHFLCWNNVATVTVYKSSKSYILVAIEYNNNDDCYYSWGECVMVLGYFYGSYLPNTSTCHNPP